MREKPVSRERASGRREEEQGSKQRREASTEGEENTKGEGFALFRGSVPRGLRTRFQCGQKITSIPGPHCGHPALQEMHKCETRPLLMTGQKGWSEHHMFKVQLDTNKHFHRGVENLVTALTP